MLINPHGNACCAGYWMAGYPLDRVIHSLNNWGLHLNLAADRPFTKPGSDRIRLTGPDWTISDWIASDQSGLVKSRPDQRKSDHLKFPPKFQIKSIATSISGK